MILECNPPLVGSNPIVLILGSMPGEESLRTKQYFAYKYNRFWQIMFKYFDRPFSESYHDRQSLVYEKHIALWETIQSCERQGSLDSGIKNEKPVALTEFLIKHPSVKAIFLNGGKAKSVYKKYFSDVGLPAVFLPSTSPANATYRFDRLFAVWQNALAEHLKQQ